MQIEFDYTPIIAATTNMFSNLDSAIKRRFSLKIKVDPVLSRKQLEDLLNPIEKIISDQLKIDYELAEKLKRRTNMDFDFFDKELKPIGTVTVGRELMKKIMSTKTIPNLKDNGEILPEESHEEEEAIDLITLSTKEKGFIGKELSELLSEEFYKEIKEKEKISNSLDDHNQKIKEEDNVPDNKDKSDTTNTQVVVELLSYIVNEDITHFRLG